MATPKKKEFNASIALKICVDVPVKADSLEEELIKSKEISVDTVLNEAYNGCIDLKQKVTGVYALEDWEK